MRMDQGFLFSIFICLSTETRYRESSINGLSVKKTCGKEREWNRAEGQKMRANQETLPCRCYPSSKSMKRAKVVVASSPQMIKLKSLVRFLSLSLHTYIHA